MTAAHFTWLALFGTAFVAAGCKHAPANDLVVDASVHLVEGGVTIDIVSDAGALSENYVPGVFALSFDPHPSYPYKRYVADIKSGDFRNTGGFQYSPNEAALMRKLVWIADQFEIIAQAGGHPHFELANMPPWLTSCPRFDAPEPASPDIGPGTCPPTDFAKWSALVERVVDYFKNQRGLDVVYSVWSSEIDGVHWSDDESSFFELYRASVLGARRADPNATIGTGVLFWDSEHYYYPMSGGPMVWSGKGPILRNFIDYAARTPLPELGYNRLPIDFIEHHRFDMTPHVGYWPASAKGIRDWLVAAGYSESTPLYLEFSSPESGNGASSEAASFLAATMMEIGALPGRAWPMYNDMFPASYEQYWNVGLFNSHFNPAYSRKDYVIRPTYNVFRMFNLLREGSSHQLRTQVSGDFLSAVSTTANDGRDVRVLVSAHVPVGATAVTHLEQLFDATSTAQATRDQRLALRSACRGSAALLECMANRLAQVPDATQRAQLKTQFELAGCAKSVDIYACLVTAAANATDATIKKEVETLAAVAERIRELSQATREIALELKGFPVDGTAEVVTYVVDDHHSNACTYNASTGTSGALCGLGGAVDTLLAESAAQVEVQVAQLPNDERAEAREALRGFCRYTTRAGTTITVTNCLDSINDNEMISLEGSRTVTKAAIVNGSVHVPWVFGSHAVVLFKVTAQ